MIPCSRALGSDDEPHDRGSLVVLQRDFLHRFLLSVRQYVAELWLVPLCVLGVGRWLVGNNGSSILPSAVQMLWMHGASSPQNSDDLYEKEFQLRREQGNYFYQGRWIAAEELSHIVQQERRKRKILWVDLWVLYGAMAVVALLLFWILRLFIAA